MGLDGHLYRTSKRRVEASKKFGEIRKAYSKDIEALVGKPKWKSLMDSLPKNEFGHYDWGSYTKEQKVRMGNLRRAVHRVAKKHGLSLGQDLRPIFDGEQFGLDETDLLMELAYFDRDWDLHNYIIDNFWKDKEHDNLVEVYLTKDDVKKIVAAGYKEGFVEALSCWDDDHVVFYYPWY